MVGEYLILELDDGDDVISNMLERLVQLLLVENDVIVVGILSCT